MKNLLLIPLILNTTTPLQPMQEDQQENTTTLTFNTNEGTTLTYGENDLIYSEEMQEYYYLYKEAQTYQKTNEEMSIKVTYYSYFRFNNLRNVNQVSDLNLQTLYFIEIYSAKLTNTTITFKQQYPEKYTTNQNLISQNNPNAVDHGYYGENLANLVQYTTNINENALQYKPSTQLYSNISLRPSYMLNTFTDHVQENTLTTIEPYELTPNPQQLNTNNYQLNLQNKPTLYLWGLMSFHTPNYDDTYVPYFSAYSLPYISTLTITANYITQFASTEILDIPALMFKILTMPFSFISQAFNLTLFPNTQYAFNISNFFLGLITISFMLWVLKLILGRADIGQWLGDQRAMAKENRLRDRKHRNAIAQESRRHEQQLQRDAKYNENRHAELTARESASHERAMKHKGKR